MEKSMTELSLVQACMDCMRPGFVESGEKRF